MALAAQKNTSVLSWMMTVWPKGCTTHDEINMLTALSKLANWSDNQIVIQAFPRLAVQCYCSLQSTEGSWVSGSHCCTVLTHVQCKRCSTEPFTERKISTETIFSLRPELLGSQKWHGWVRPGQGSCGAFIHGTTLVSPITIQLMVTQHGRWRFITTIVMCDSIHLW